MTTLTDDGSDLNFVMGVLAENGEGLSIDGNMDTLDELIEDYCPAPIKIDVEGDELSVKKE